MEIYTTFTFDAAHKLPCVPEGHKCGNIHGHTFTAEVHVSGPVESETGWVIDFNDIKKIIKPIEEQLDHKYLNDIIGLENPTSECIAKWIWQRVKPALPALSKIVVKESPKSGAIYSGEDE